MLQYIVIIGFFLLALGIMFISLYASGYKRGENSGCCGGGHCANHAEKSGHGTTCTSRKLHY
ncbi:MAG: hypothetical protein U5R06_20910 [candidate division KSB1 bacterium]|nr:hypothetical protein [candidate division KSB1 bacterium]